MNHSCLTPYDGNTSNELPKRCTYVCEYYAADTWDTPEESWPRFWGYGLGQGGYYNKEKFKHYFMGRKNGCGNPKDDCIEDECPSGKDPKI